MISSRIYKERIVPAFWKAYFKVYDKLTGLPAYRAMISSCVNSLNVTTGGRYADLGSGTANVSVEIANRNGCILAVDQSPHGLELGREKFAKLGFTENIHFKIFQADIDSPEGRTAVFGKMGDCEIDGVVMVNVVYLLRNTKPLLEQILRITKPGGRLVIADPRIGGKYSDALKDAIVDRWKQAETTLQKIGALFAITKMTATFLEFSLFKVGLNIGAGGKSFNPYSETDMLSMVGDVSNGSRRFVLENLPETLYSGLSTKYVWTVSVA